MVCQGKLGLFGRLKPLRVSSRIHLMSFVVLGAIVALGAAHFIGSRTMSHSLDRQQKFDKLTHLAHEVEIGALQMRREEKDFLLHHGLQHVLEYKVAADKTEKTLSKMSEIAGKNSTKERIERLRTEVASHREKLFKVHKLFVTLGRDETLGLQGGLRKAVHVVEQRLKVAKLDDLTVKMLMMRRHEKDYMVRGQQIYVDRLDKRRVEFNALMMSAPLSEVDKAEILALMDTYQNSFSAYVTIAKILAVETRELSAIFTRMVPDFQVIFFEAAKARKHAEASAVSDRNQTAKLFMAAAALILLSAMGLAQIIGNSISAPIERQTEAMKKLAEGDTSIEIPDAEIANEIGDMARAVRVFRDNAIDRLRLQDIKLQLEQIAYFDTLTGLANRAHCQKDMVEKFSTAGPDCKFAIIQLDIDNFKRVNDRLGHAAGDHLLHTLGERLSMLASDFQNFKSYRWGGDEFIALIERDDNTNLSAICQEMTDLIAIPLEFGEATLRPTVSLGVARYPEDATNVEELMVFSDLALYKTKELGRDGYQFFTSEMKEKVDSESRIEEEIRIALDEDQLELYYQPQVNINDESISGLEALLRWHHPERGLLAPGEFLPVAEAAGLASAIGCKVFDEAMRAIHDWVDEGLEFGRLAVNLSPQHLKKNTVLTDLFNAMDKYSIEPDYLAVEFLESFLLDDPNANVAGILDQLRTRGIHVELDDFGTGYASLSHLSTMPINGLKIDRSFINHMVNDTKQQGIVSALISMSKLLDLRVVCEGIETRQQLDVISQIGNCSIQGYFVSKPMSHTATTEWIRNKHNIGILGRLPDLVMVNGYSI